MMGGESGGEVAQVRSAPGSEKAGRETQRPGSPSSELRGARRSAGAELNEHASPTQTCRRYHASSTTPLLCGVFTKNEKLLM